MPSPLNVIQHHEGMKTFRDELNDIVWTEETARDSLATIFAAADKLAEREVTYYDRRRHRLAAWSIFLRVLAWISGSIGVTLPLLFNIITFSFDPHGKLGYLFLGASACLLGANSLFDITNGHVRVANTQFKLIQVIISARISWQSYKAEICTAPCSAVEIQKGLEQISTYLQNIYTIIRGETDNWGTSIQAELEKYQTNVDSKA